MLQGKQKMPKYEYFKLWLSRSFMLKILRHHALHTKLHQYLPSGILPGNNFPSRRYCICDDPTISGSFLCMWGSLAVTPSTLDRQEFLDDMTLEDVFSFFLGSIGIVPLSVQSLWDMFEVSLFWKVAAFRMQLTGVTGLGIKNWSVLWVDEEGPLGTHTLVARTNEEVCNKDWHF